MKKIISIILILVISISLCGCNSENKDDKKIIAVSIAPQATFVQKVCGDNFNVVTVIPPGASAETYEPTIPEIADLNDALIYFSIGVPVEQNIVLPSITDKEKIVELHTAVEDVYPALDIDGERDPHLWLSPKRVIVMVKKIAETLMKTDPENSEIYKENAEKYCKEIENLDKEITKLLGEKQNRKFIVFHPAFGYFANDYSLTMYALEEHGKEADAKHLAEMSDLAKKEGIKSVFYGAETSHRQAEAFAEELGGKAVCLEPLSPDYVENLRTMAKTIAEN